MTLVMRVWAGYITIVGIGILGVLGLVTWGATYSLIKNPEQPGFQVTCFNTKGVVIYTDKTRFIPSVYRSPYMTCIVKNIKETE
jgi:hypothetical protein